MASDSNTMVKCITEITEHASQNQKGQLVTLEPVKLSPRKELGRAYYNKKSRKELGRAYYNKKSRNGLGSTKCKSSKQISVIGTKACKSPDSKKNSLNLSMVSNAQFPQKKQTRKGESCDHHSPAGKVSSHNECSRTWVCKNSACRAVLSLDDTFCKRCSCCICHLFDDNKDPSLWLVCASESNEQDSCSLSCHIECALQRGKVGVVNLGQSLHLDGSYCCSSCGKVSGIIGTWKKQLVIAKDARRIDVLCYRIFLSYRLLDGTSRFKELLEIVRDARNILESEVGSLSGVSAKMARGIVSRLSIASDVQKFCSLAIEKADAWLNSTSSVHHKEDSLPPACKFQFEDITSSSLIVVLKEVASTSDNVKGYKLWYYKSQEDSPSVIEPISVFPRDQRRMLISNLQPCTEYTFRIISFTEDGDLGHSEAKCFTKSVEIIPRVPNPATIIEHKGNIPSVGIKLNSRISNKSRTTNVGSSNFKIRDLGKVLRLVWAQEQGCFDEFCDNYVKEHFKGNGILKEEVSVQEHCPSGSCNQDLNINKLPDLNAEISHQVESPKDDDTGYTSDKGNVVEVVMDFHEVEGNTRLTSNGSDDSETCAAKLTKDVPAVESRRQSCRKRSPSEDEGYDCDSTLIDGSPLQVSSGGGYGCLDENYEYCVKIIRWLECGGHIGENFRMKFLTWFSLRSSERERRVVNTFIQTLVDDPSSLAGQLIDSFLDVVNSKKLSNGFCSKLWH